MPPETDRPELIPAPLAPAPARQSRQTPTIAFESLRFFETGDELPQSHASHYRTHFAQSTCRYIYYDLTVKNLRPEQDQTFLLEQRVYSAHGKLEGQSQHEYVLKANEERWMYPWGFGWPEAGRWKTGTYRMEILIDGVTFAVGSFTIE